MSDVTLISGAFRFLDTTGCSTTHSPRERLDLEVAEADAAESAPEGAQVQVLVPQSNL